MNTAANADLDESLSSQVVPSLRSNFSWTLVGGFVYSACQWGMISALAKLGSALLVGRFALGLAITAPVFMFTNMQLRAVQATDARSEFAFANYFSLRLVSSLTAFFLICLIAMAGRWDRSTGIVIVLVGLAKTIETLSDLIAGLLQKVERLNRVAISMMLRGGLSLAAFGFVFWISRKLADAVVALAAARLLVFVLYDLRQARFAMQVRDRFLAFKWSRLKTLAVVSAPLGVVMTLVSLNVNIPRYLLAHVLGQAELGIFASLAYLLVVVSLVINALGQAAVTRLSRSFARGDIRHFRNVLAKLLVFAVVVLLFGIPAAQSVARPLLTAIYRPEYGQHVTLFVIMVAIAGVSAIASFLGYGMTAARCFRMQVPVMAAMTASTVLFAFILIPRFGGRGAAYALLIGAGVQVAGSAVVLHRAMHAQRRVA